MATRMDGPGSRGVTGPELDGGLDATAVPQAAGLDGLGAIGGPAMEAVVEALRASVQRGELADAGALTEAFVHQMLQAQMPGAPQEFIAERAEDLTAVLRSDPEFERRLARLVRSAD